MPASGIGQECALAFAAHGAAGVVFVDLDLARVQAIAEKSAKIAKNPAYRSLPLSVDVADSNQVRDMVSQTISMFGKIDYNVNCAGVSQLQPQSGFCTEHSHPGFNEYCNLLGEYLHG